MRAHLDLCIKHIDMFAVSKPHAMGRDQPSLWTECNMVIIFYDNRDMSCLRRRKR
jgi:hypothetical protein